VTAGDSPDKEFVKRATFQEHNVDTKLPTYVDIVTENLPIDPLLESFAATGPVVHIAVNTSILVSRMTTHAIMYVALCVCRRSLAVWSIKLILKLGRV
jgi:hypothetical protein